MWKEIMRWCMPRGGWLLAAVAFVVAAGVATPLVAQAATVNVWNLGAEVTDLRIGPSDEVWTMAGDKPRMLDPGTNEVISYSHELAGTGVLAVDGAGMVWSPDYLSPPGSVISQLDPTTLDVTSWLFLTSSTDATSIAVDGSGNVWVGGKYGGGVFGPTYYCVWRLAPGTNTITKWTLPITGVAITRHPFDPSGRVWLRYSGGVAVLDPSSSELIYWAAPSGTWQYPFAHTDGNVWFAVQKGVDTIARLNPSTNEVTEWPCRAGCDGLTRVHVDSDGKVWFTEKGTGTANASYIGRLDPGAVPPAFSEWPFICADVIGGSCSSTQTTWPYAVEFDSAGDLWTYFGYASYGVYHRVARLTP